MAQQFARNADVSLEESVDVPSDQVAHSAFGMGANTYTTLTQDASKKETTVSSSRGTEELGHLVEEVSPDPDPANTTVAAIYDPETGVYSRPDTGKIEVGPIGSTLDLDEHLQERLEKLEPPAADARLHSARIKRGATEIDKNLGIGSEEPSAPAPQEPVVNKDESSFSQRQAENSHDLDPIQQLEKAEIIPLLIDRVQGTPSLKFEVKFGGKEVRNGATLQPQDIHHVPEVLLYKHGVVTPEDVYLLLLVDMDFSDDGGFLYWLVQNVPSPTEAYLDPVRVFGQELMPYEGKSSQTRAEQHRLVFLLYKMKRKLMSSAAPRTRENFIPRHFAQNNELGQPEAALYFKL